MEVKPGYKQTEVGVIPEDWEIIDLSNLCKLQRGFDITEATKVAGTVPVYSSSGLSYFHNKAMVLPPGVVTGRKGILGKVFLIDEPFWPHDTTLWVKDFKNNHPAYVALVLKNFHLDRLDAATSVPTLNRNNLTGYLIAIPPTLPEQTAIATVLSDTDALIESLDQLIAKKRNLKLAAMQQLLTGKRRLPGFEKKTGYKLTEVGGIPEDWEVKALGDVAEIRSGGTPSTNQPEFWDGDVLWCTPTDITGLKGFKYLRQTSRTITTQGLKCSSAELVPAYSVVMTSRATIGECAINAVPVATNQGFKNFVPFQTTDGEFLYYLLQTKKQDFISLCGGSTFLEIGKTQLAAFNIALPKDKLEQTAIATLLSNMDAEIAAIEACRDKTHSLKQGMMHNLLTGKVRLV